ncbi:MAG: hypothetical protein K2N01_02850 [Lachnospiraceae bacterium]|nr:hypothetical protein [Lachnospiraceae bacterium]
MKFFEVNGSAFFMVYEAECGTLTFTKPKRNEALVYLSENYGIQKDYEFEIAVVTHTGFYYVLTTIDSYNLPHFALFCYFCDIVPRLKRFSRVGKTQQIEAR